MLSYSEIKELKELQDKLDKNIEYHKNKIRYYEQIQRGLDIDPENFIEIARHTI